MYKRKDSKHFARMITTSNEDEFCTFIVSFVISLFGIIHNQPVGEFCEIMVQVVTAPTLTRI